MEAQKSKESVVSRVMGLDEVKLPVSTQKLKRVLSENYLCRVASIGAVKKRSCRDRRPQLASIHRGNKQVEPKSFDSVIVNPQTSLAFQRSPEFLDSPNDCFGEITSKRNSLVPKGVEDLQVKFSISNSGDRDDRNCRKSRRTDQYLKPRLKQENHSNKQTFGHRMDFIRQSSGLSLSQSGSSAWKRQLNYFSFSGKSFVSEPKKLSERLPNAQIVKNGEPVSKENILGEMFEMQNQDSRRGNHKPERFSKHEAFRRKWSLRSEKSLNLAKLKLRRYKYDNDTFPEPRDMKLKANTSKSFFDSQDSRSYSAAKDTNSKTNNKLEDCDMYQKNKIPSTKLIGSISSPSTASDMVVDNKTEITVKPSDKLEVEQLGSASSSVSEESDYCSSHASDASAQQVTSAGFSEESCEFQNCYRMELADAMVILDEVCHPSPISVLEQPFSGETMHCSELSETTVDDICDTSETNSEEPEMAVSSDGETTEELTRDSHENKKFMKNWRVEESRKFSYLVDVLAEASLNGRNLAKFHSWHSLDCPVSLLIFESLEKKYGYQTSWKSSERRLLFDLMNAGIRKILLPCIGVQSSKKLVSRSVGIIRDEEMLEEDLWKLLVCQEKESGKNTTEKMIESELGKIELGDEIDAIGREIERLLFDELLAEFF